MHLNNADYLFKISKGFVPLHESMHLNNADYLFKLSKGFVPLNSEIFVQSIGPIQ